MPSLSLSSQPVPRLGSEKQRSGRQKIQKKKARDREKEEEGEELEVKEESAPRPPAQLWHQEGAQQLSKAEPHWSKGVDAALATDHVEPPFLRKRNRVYTCFHLRTVSSTSSHRRAPAVSFFLSRARSHCRSPSLCLDGDDEPEPFD